MAAMFHRYKSLRTGLCATLLAFIMSGCGLAPVAQSVGKAPSNARTTAGEAIELFRSWDADGNTIVTAEEFPYSLQLYGELEKMAGGALNIHHFAALYPKYLDMVQRMMSEPRGWFRLYDKDGNGRLDGSEIARLPEAKAVMERFDLNRDGVLTLQEAEILSLPPHRWRSLALAFDLIREFDVWDRDKNGALDARELGRERYLIEMLDSDGDGLLQFEELKVVQKLRLGGPKALERYALRLQFERLDSDKDGRLSPKELGRHGRVAKWLDKDGDGHISREEFMEMYEARKNLLRSVQIHDLIGKQ